MGIEFEISGPKGSAPPEQAAFKSAAQYYEGAIRCATPVPNPNADNSSFFPAEVAVVNVAFSAELFLKSLLLATGQDVIKSHRLDKLFNSLPQHLQKDIRKRYCELTRTKSLTMKKHLSQISNAFVDWRYSFDKVIEIGAVKVFALARASFEIALEEYPDWIESISEYTRSRICGDYWNFPLFHLANLGGGYKAAITRLPET